MRLLSFVTVSLMTLAIALQLTGCENKPANVTLLASCRSAAATLDALAELRDAGQLSIEVEQQARDWAPVVVEACVGGLVVD